MKLETEFKPGDFVRYGEPNGSTGKIIEETHYSTPDNRTYYVEWVYGTDKAGVPMVCSGSVKAWQCVRITEAEYNAVRDKKGF